MTNTDIIFRNMQELADQQGWPTHFKDDLLIDQKTLNSENYNDVNQFIWLLRDCGTNLYPINIGMHPDWLTSYESHLDSGRSIAYLINRFSTKVVKISYREALALLDCDIKLNLSSDFNKAYQQIVDFIELNRRRAGWGVMSQPSFDSKDLNSWDQWFEGNGYPYMSRLIARLDNINDQKGVA